MLSRRNLSIIVLPVLIGIAGCAFNPLEIEPYREVSCLEAARISLSDAVRAAEIEGGKAIDAAYRQPEEMGCLEGDAGYYDVTVLMEGQLVPLSVDARSEQIQPHLPQSLARNVTGQYFERLAEGRSSARSPIAARETIGLSDAIRTAEKNGGKAMEARVEAKRDRPGYAVKLVDHGRLRMDWVDGAKTP